MARKHVNWKVAKQPNTALAMASNSTDFALQNAPTSFFAQLIDLLPKNRLLAHFDKHCPRRSATKFSAWDHFIALLFCHLAGCDSLRELDDGLYSACGKLNQLDAKPMKRTALAYANQTRSYRIFEQCYMLLLDYFKPMLGRRKLQKAFEKPVYSLDSTTITVCLSRFDWAKYRTSKGGFKLHSIIDNDHLMPCVMNLTTGKVHDAALAQTTIEKLPAANITVVMDRGYNDYSLFAWLSKRGTTFVTRLKDNAVTTPLKKGCRSEGDNYGDYQFEFDSPAGREACGELQFRVVQWHDTDNDRWFNFLTNDMDLKPEQIAALYKERWQIELFFKKIKQNLKIKSFIGTNENAVMSQIWTAAIVTLLIEVLKQRSLHKWSFPRLLHFVRLNLMTHKSLRVWLDYPDVRMNDGKRNLEKPPEIGMQAQLPF